MTLKNLSFRGGVHPKGYKELSSGSEIVEMDAPEKVVIPLQQNIGSECKPVVEVGDHVKLGQLIGQAVNNMGVSVHSSVSGVVTKIEKIVKTSGHEITSVFIDNDGKDEIGYERKENVDLNSLTRDEILDNIKKAGVSGLGGAGFPTHVKLDVKEGEVDTVILNGAECEPYLTCDDQLMRTYPKEIIQGLKLAMKVTGAKRGYIAIEDNKEKAIKAIEESISDSNIELAILKTKYPQGDEKRIIQAVTKRKVPYKGLPKDVGVVVVNVGTSKAIYDSSFGIPQYKRVLTVSGMAVKEPKNISVRIGTPLYECIEFCGGLTEAPEELVVGGPMMGFSQDSFDRPVEKGVTGIICMTKEEINEKEEEACIACGKCVDVCPQHLLPAAISRAVEARLFEKARGLSVEACIECGSCAYICPANRPLVTNIRKAKTRLGRKK